MCVRAPAESAACIITSQSQAERERYRFICTSLDRAMRIAFHNNQ